jgi:hypothetical protein
VQPSNQARHVSGHIRPRSLDLVRFVMLGLLKTRNQGINVQGALSCSICSLKNISNNSEICWGDGTGWDASDSRKFLRHYCISYWTRILLQVNQFFSHIAFASTACEHN